MNICWFFGAVLVATAATTLFGAYAAALVMLVPLPCWEAGGYALSAWLLRRSTTAAPGAAPYVALTGLLAFSACAAGSIALHDLARRLRGSKEAAASALLAFMAALYGAMAVRLQVGGE